MEILAYVLAVYFAFGYAIEREQRRKAQKEIDRFYGNN